MNNPDEPAAPPRPKFDIGDDDSSRIKNLAKDPGPVIDIKKSTKKRNIIIGVVLTVLILLVGGGYLVYAKWYQNPEKVLSDAIVSVLQAKTVTYAGSLSIDPIGEDKDDSFVSNIVLNINGANSRSDGRVGVELDMDVKGKKISLAGEGVYDEKSDFYFKISGIQKATDSLKVDEITLSKAVDNFVKRIDDRWIKVSSEDIKEYNPQYEKVRKCTNEVWNRYKNDKETTDEIVEIYKKNRFVIIEKELEVGDDNFGYLIDTNSTKMKTFIKDIKETYLVEDLMKCDASSEINEDDFAKKTKISERDNTRFELWVDKQTHQITKLIFDTKSDDFRNKLVIEPHFDAPVSIDSPKNFIHIYDLKDDFKAISDEVFDEFDDLKELDSKSKSQSPTT